MSKPPTRLASIDALRGWAMILMALDHVRDFNHAGVPAPENLATTTAMLFFTRWITHICAPAFMFTAGLGAFFWLERDARRSTAELTRFLMQRGVWLLVLEFTVFRFVLSFSLVQGPVLLVVLWALGWAMMALGVLVRLPLPVNAALSVGMMLLHNLFDGVKDWGWWWNILHRQGPVQLGDITVIVAYPLIPWVGVMAAGYCFGALMKKKSAEWISGLGLVLVASFFVLRYADVYGDSVKWDGTLMSFFRCTKYPPSLAFLLMTLGPALCLLGWFGRREWSAKNPLMVFGRTPLFYFVVHLYLARAMGVLLSPGVGLGGVYAVWACVVLAAYPLCVWFARVKERGGHWWLAYL